MSTALAERPIDIAPAELELVKRTVASGATDAELKLFLFDCQRRGVHPLDKLLHFTKRGGKYTPVTSIDFMRSQAAMSGEMAGSDDVVFSGYSSDEEPWKAPPNEATVTVYRLTQGQRFGYTATARWHEYYPGDGPGGTMWRKMPRTMLGKCAEALALRKAFPQQLAGLYSREEMDQAGEPQGYTVTPTSTALPITSSGILSAATEGTSGNDYAGTQSGVNGVPPITDWGAIPEGLVRIASVRPGGGKVVGELVAHTGEVFAIFQQPVKAIAEQCCQDGIPVRLDVKVSGTSGKAYVKHVHPVPQVGNGRDEPDVREAPPLTDDDIPFAWFMPFLLPMLGFIGATLA